MEMLPPASRLCELPATERPRERMMSCGPDQVANAELLAILLRTGRQGTSALALAQQLLGEKEGLLGVARCSWEDFTAIAGIGPAKALQLVAACELGKRIAQALPGARPLLDSPQAIVHFMREELRFAGQEHFVCLFLNVRYRFIAKKTVFKGSLDITLVHPRDIFREAVRTNAAMVVCLHNHPSGDPEPSAADLGVTKRLRTAGELMGIPLFDHVILGDQRYVSLRERGWPAPARRSE